MIPAPQKIRWLELDLPEFWHVYQELSCITQIEFPVLETFRLEGYISYHILQSLVEQNCKSLLETLYKVHLFVCVEDGHQTLHLRLD
jgi:hypothetical protein